MTIFQKGEEWLEEVKRYISTNKKSADNFMKKHIPSFHLVDSDATYLLRIECKRFSPFVDLFCSYLKDKKGLLVSSESSYGENESDFIRINIPLMLE